MRIRSQSGVTLMELLIAISLLSLISVSVLMAMRVGINAMEKANSRVFANRRVTGAQRVLEQQVAGLIATTADCRQLPSAQPTTLPFFQGAPQTMRFVSSYSLQEAHRGYPRILEYQVIPTQDGRGVRLIVNEHLYSGPLSTGALCLGPGPPGMGTMFQPVQIMPRSFVLADRLAGCQFAFQQYVQPATQTSGMKEWTPIWSENGFPLAIRVEMAQLEPDPGGIPLLSMTIPVRVTKDPTMLYED